MYVYDYKKEQEEKAQKVDLEDLFEQAMAIRREIK
jgi:hypothetical protein